MDQDKVILPHFNRPPKCYDCKSGVKHIITCSLVHGRCCLNWVGNNNFPHDSNYTVTVVHR